jgi:hypothetical protein
MGISMPHQHAAAQAGCIVEIQRNEWPLDSKVGVLYYQRTATAPWHHPRETKAFHLHKSANIQIINRSGSNSTRA